MVKARSKSEEKRKQILDAATRLFTEQGYSSTSMGHIAEQANVSKQTVYSHFGNKDDLFSAAIEQKCDSFHMVDFCLDDIAEPETILFNLAQRFLAMLVSKEALAVHKICAYESTAHPQLAELFFQAGPERLTKKVSELMSMFNQKGILEIEHPKTAAWQFLNMVRGETFLRTEFNTQKQVSAEETLSYLLACVKLFIRGYQKRE